jgi:hypothetical protein
MTTVNRYKVTRKIRFLTGFGTSLWTPSCTSKHMKMHSHTHWHTLDTHEGFPPWLNPKHKENRNLTSPLSYSPWDTVTQHPWAPPSHLNSRNHHCEGRHTLLLLLFFQKWARVKKQPDRKKNSTSRFTVQIYTRCQWGVNNHMNLRFYIQNLSTFSTQGQKDVSTSNHVPVHFLLEPT